ncbi:cyanophycinase [Ramlibacter monticola]|uniref:Cyanophycinase n=1 Tax=Ramlibacter monticola TaxID=1926872 RepID=A0A936Z0R5_9BURK|nr:cyanophycinase [Ramlibacter monticola]MBL0392518.1 cyanophycinase [Ramlibacter monticola]
MRRRDLLFSSLLTGSTMPLAAQASVRGRLVIVGGAEDRVQDRLILRRFLQYAGGPQARIRLLAAASAVPLVVAESYRRAFAEIGTGGCELLPLLERDAAFRPDTVQAILDADAIFISGGNQSRLMDVLRDTPAMTALQHAHGHLGCCIGGTSAGAAAMSRHMIAQGMAVRHPRKDAVGTGIGLGLLPAAIVDQHFSERGRLARLLSALAQRPDLLGVGVDEDTALVVESEEAIEVIGSGAVTLVDPSSAHTNIGELAPESAIEMLGLQLHTLPPGRRYPAQPSPQNAAWPAGLLAAVQRLVAPAPPQP